MRLKDVQQPLRFLAVPEPGKCNLFSAMQPEPSEKRWHFWVSWHATIPYCSAAPGSAFYSVEKLETTKLLDPQIANSCLLETIIGPIVFVGSVNVDLHLASSTATLPLYCWGGALTQTEQHEGNTRSSSCRIPSLLRLFLLTGSMEMGWLFQDARWPYAIGPA